jgi:hypothetical protein
MRVAVSSICFLAVAGACASTAPSTSRFATSPEPQYEHLTPAEFAARQDSAQAQQIANETGPGASIRAEFSTVSGMRRVVASFHVDADAYVLIGHIDADGILRVAFPLEPGDDGFVRGNRNYYTPEFFAGFADEYRYRAQQPGFRYAARPIDSYDGSLGYAFIIASWRPLRFDQFQTDGRWDSFELADEKYMNDPRPAIYELASLLAGQNREAYTVAFAKYTTTMPLAGYGGSSAFAFGQGGDLAFCQGFGQAGFGFSNLWFSSVVPVGFDNAWGYPSAFYSQGQYFFYDDLAGCYRSANSAGYYRPYYGFGRIAAGGPGQVPVTPIRGLKPRDRSPSVPQAPAIHTLPSRLGAIDANGQLPVSPSYRQRGLITPDDPVTVPSRRTPAIDTHSQIENRTRPSIQDRVNRHPETPSGTDGLSRGQSLGRPATTERPSVAAPESRRAEPTIGTTRTYQPPQDQSRAAQPARVETRTYQPPQDQSRAAQPPRVETRSYQPPPQVERSAPPPPRPAPEMRMPESRPSSPPPAPPAQSQPPASSSSNPPATGSRPPG